MNKNEALFLSLKEINRLCDTGKITGETINTIQAIKAALEAKDEPVAWMREDGTLHFADKNIFYVGQPFYTTPPQRTWVGLTNEEREQLINANTATGLWHMAKDIEAKLKEKNT